MNLSHLKTGDLIVHAKRNFITHHMVYIENRGENIIVAENQTQYGCCDLCLSAQLR